MITQNQAYNLSFSSYESEKKPTTIVTTSPQTRTPPSIHLPLKEIDLSDLLTCDPLRYKPEQGHMEPRDAKFLGVIPASMGPSLLPRT
ncbi:hypothetical protein CDAR_259031 [Caerostris darwini]|uniref:Uncharacterized protein n=1 Tax=Caerostris darwini TaxID=1538125 RepID=A0AAV4PTU5_9ARAC|nr:hypothetical protein CDAR_259031 [Caerostris darwini]